MKTLHATPVAPYLQPEKYFPHRMKVNEDLNELVNDYIHLEGNATSVYKLRTPEELGEGVEIPPPPPTPVFPPQMPRGTYSLVLTNFKKI